MPNATASLWALLGRLFSAEIDADLIATLRTPAIREIFEKIEPGGLDHFDSEGAAAEYCRLFILPGGVPAVAAAWLSGADPNNSASIAGLVHNLRTTLDLSLPAELPPDHLGVLCSLMAWLQEHQPAAASDFQHAALSPWLGQFAKALGERAEEPIYRVTAKILRSLG